MVQDAKLVAININDSNAVSRWRESNRAVSGSVAYHLIINVASFYLIRLLLYPIAFGERWASS